MTGFATKMPDWKRKRLIKLTIEGLSTGVIAERLGMKQSQVTYHQKRLGIWKGVKRK